jgi:hypothetical protein
MRFVAKCVVLSLFGIVAGCEGGVGPDPDAPFCGGIAGFPCPGEGTCVDDPSDDCDPQQGGADCGGLCVCPHFGKCETGERWDSSEEVCACVADVNPCAAVLCLEGSVCVVQNGAGVCVPFEGEACGDVTCGPGLVCCNASCGICTPPGFACIQIACE